MGIDPSSTICGIALVDTPDKVVSVAHWERDKNKSHVDGFTSYYKWLTTMISFSHPDMAVIEFASYTGPKANAANLQAVSFYQAISALACKQCGLIVLEARASQARKATLGNGGLSKEAVWDIMKKRYPNLFAAKMRGGLDQMDALVLALAGTRVAER